MKAVQHCVYQFAVSMNSNLIRIWRDQLLQNLLSLCNIFSLRWRGIVSLFSWRWRTYMRILMSIFIFWIADMNLGFFHTVSVRRREDSLLIVLDRFDIHTDSRCKEKQHT
jgi:hypothetical protein